MKANTDLMTRIKKALGSCYRKLALERWLTPVEFAQMRERGDWSILDVRTLEERAVSVIPGALDKNEFESRSEALRDRNLLVYCTIGCRSGDYSKSLLKRGFKAFNLWGGVMAWAASEGEFVSPSGQETRQVHINDLPPDLLHLGYSPVR